MHPATIAEAIGTLRQQGQRVSVRAVHALTGGSFRDISAHLRRLVTTKEPSMVTAPPMSRIEHAREVLREKEAALDALCRQSQQFNATLRAIDTARRQAGGSLSVSLETQYATQKAQALRGLQELHPQVQQARRAVINAQRHVQSLESRAATLPRIISGYHHDLSPQGPWGKRVRDAEQRLELFRREYEAKHAELLALEAELIGLTGMASAPPIAG